MLGRAHVDPRHGALLGSEGCRGLGDTRGERHAGPELPAYFFLALALGAGLAGALAFAFFLSLPWELLPLAIVKSFHERCCASITACCTYPIDNPSPKNLLRPFCATNLVPSFLGAV